MTINYNEYETLYGAPPSGGWGNEYETDQVEFLGDLGEILFFAANKTDRKHWKRTRKRNY
jgi:hypothetical protein